MLFVFFMKQIPAHLFINEPFHKSLIPDPQVPECPIPDCLCAQFLSAWLPIYPPLLKHLCYNQCSSVPICFKSVWAAFNDMGFIQ